MNKRPVLLRTLIAIATIVVFAFSMYPLTERDFYETFTGMLKDSKNPEAARLVTEAKAMQEKDKALFASQALLKAADDSGVELRTLIRDTTPEDNRDVMSAIRKNASSSIRRGLDLAGGVEFMLQLVPDKEFLDKLNQEGEKNGNDRETIEAQMKNQFDHYRDVAIEILRKRLESQKIFEAEISPSGSSHVSIKAPVVAKDEKIKLLNLISMSAKLRFRLVHPQNAQLIEEYLRAPEEFVAPAGYELMTTSEMRPGQKPLVRYYLVEMRPAMDGKNVSNAFPTRTQFGQRQISLSFNSEGARQFARVTTENVNRELAIVLDGKLYCAPNINEPITGGSASISGNFSDEECKTISDALLSGSFPFEIKVDAVFDTDPKLGADNVQNGVWVAIWSMVAVAVFMCGYYMLGGVISVIALALNLVLIMGAMAAFDATLTLPGIAGIVLTIGMAVDANVLIFERIREELRNGKSLIPAVDAGYSRALSAVIDANVTTLITAVILMSVGTGAVKGFAVTLSIGILTTMFTAVFLTRLMFDWLFNLCPDMKTLKMRQFFTRADLNFPKLWKTAVPVSAGLCIVSLIFFFIVGKGLLGVDFTGGTQVTFNYEKQIPATEIEKALSDLKYQAAVNYKFSAGGDEGRKLEILIRDDVTKRINDPTIVNTEVDNPKEIIGSYLNKKFPEAKLSGGQEASVGGLIGLEFTKAALWAIFFSMIGIGAYLTLRYEFSYAAASLTALAFDVIIVMGIYAALGRTISLTVVAAILTVIGYSVNDKVVVFDRVRENVRSGVKGSYLETITESLNQTLSRTILTSLTTFIVVLILFIWGGIAINDFVLIMMLGVIVGTYSSMFIAAPFTAFWNRKVSKLDVIEDDDLPLLEKEEAK